MPARPIVVVTGASAGVGRATARRFAADGYDVGLLARGRDGLEAAAAEVRQRGGRALVLVADVADADAVEQAAGQVERELGPIDVWVNNAMVTVMSRIADLPAADVRRVTEVTYLGTVHGTMAALRRMRPRNRGSIVQVGSALAYRAIPLQSAYCAAKFAVRGFTDSLRTELMHDGSDVHVSMVQLPALNTPQFGWSRLHKLGRFPQPVPPIFQPEVAADGIFFAAHSRRREVFVGGNVALLVWINKFAPWAGDWWLARSGYDSQFTDQPADPERPGNLDHPLPGDAGAHGVFDARARRRSLQLEMTQRRGLIGACAAVAGVAALAMALRRG